ncbi:MULTISPECIES: hypothetical protein [Niallia]|uniref:Uncharacterized protein n=1 Tax=Niallia circulans TaxID=1397 RepID=A0AA91YYT2_NIACI|nr:hypothetical protein [Niallia circulans]PAD80646.1 hypothetical protein CHH57_24100 [Niallia circulans]
MPSSISPKSRKLLDLKLPNMEKESNFQFVAFPFRIQFDTENYKSQQTFGSFIYSFKIAIEYS